jgi:beta-phosphoglucomutase-like phosphatase (HAD superfamily)
MKVKTMPVLIGGVDVRAIKWDLDGTKVGYLPIVIEEAHKLLTAELARLGKLVELDAELFRGRPVLQAARDVLLANSFNAGVDVLNRIFWAHHDAVNARLKKDGLQATPGLIPLLRRLKAKDPDLIMCTVSSNTHERIDLCLELADIATYIPPGNRYSSYVPHIGGHKPHPGVYLHAIEMQNVQPWECAAAEDSPDGVSAAVAAKIGVVVGYVGDYYPVEIRPVARRRLIDRGAHFVIEHWDEFPLDVPFSG